MSAAVALIQTLRPKQWVKNIFVAAPLVFARHLGDLPYVARTACAVLAFSLVSGAVYAFNDVLDVEADRAHPIKCKRPIAAGALSERAALVAAAVIALTAIGGAALLSVRLAGVCAVYAVLNVAYSARLKQIAFLDVGLIAVFFILRVLAGAAAIDVPASGWVLACMALLATYLGFGKRAHELSWALRSGGETGTTRASLLGYRLPVVRVAMIAVGAATCAAYVAYTLDAHTVEFFHTDRLVWSAPFVALGLVRFFGLALWWPRDDSPTEAMLKDPWFLLDLAAAAGVILYVIY